MQIDVEDKQLSVVLNEAKFDVALTTDAPLDVNVGESAKIDVGQAISNVQSGKAEIEAAVQDGKAAFNLNATDKTTDFNANAVAKTLSFDVHAADSINEAKSWAIGEPVEPAEGSAKYWAGRVGGLISRVDTIESKIPSAATASNQLADKDWVESQEYITGITSSDVTTALGYTPYNSSNPSGYQTASDVQTAIAGKQDILTSANAGTGISITGSGSNVVISNTQTSAEWGNITGTLSDQTDLQTALSGKADVDMSNVTTSGKSLISGLPMPSNRYTDLTFGASGTEYTAPANGYFFVEKTAGATGKYLSMLNTTSGVAMEVNPTVSTNWPKCWIMAAKDDVVRIEYTLTGATRNFKFIYAEGEPNV